MLAILAASLVYLACVLFFQAHAKRTTIEKLRVSSVLRKNTRVVAWVLVFAALYVFSSLQGWERGIPVWFGALTLAAFISLLTATLAPKKHVMSGGLAFISAAISGSSVLVEWVL